jgi:predicted GIY-YIG superfamily endonuclease
MKRTTLYRAYTADNELLYVGISAQVITRLDQHKDSAKWLQDCAYVTLEHFRTRTMAHRAEVVAIKNEDPKFNILHKAKA